MDLTEKQSFCEPLRLATEYGDILMSLCHTPPDSLTVTILKAWDLRSMDINLKSDPYVKLCLRCADRRMDKRKTKIVKCTLNPVFNEAFHFNVTNTNIEESSLEIVVMDFDNIGRDELIGRIMLSGMYYYGFIYICFVDGVRNHQILTSYAFTSIQTIFWIILNLTTPLQSDLYSSILNTLV